MPARCTYTNIAFPLYIKINVLSSEGRTEIKTKRSVVIFISCYAESHETTNYH